MFDYLCLLVANAIEVTSVPKPLGSGGWVGDITEPIDADAD